MTPRPTDIQPPLLRCIRILTGIAVLLTACAQDTSPTPETADVVDDQAGTLGSSLDDPVVAFDAGIVDSGVRTGAGSSAPLEDGNDSGRAGADPSAEADAGGEATDRVDGGHRDSPQRMDASVGTVTDEPDDDPPHDHDSTGPHCQTPCDCPNDLPICRGARCSAAAAICLSDWGCGCGEVCLDGTCQPPDIERGCMWACECPPGLPFCGAEDFQCQTTPSEGELWAACECGATWDSAREQCVVWDVNQRPCDSSDQCLYSLWSCQDQQCVLGVPGVCDDQHQCPVPLLCDSLTGVCRE